jgi:endonuclease G
MKDIFKFLVITFLLFPLKAYAQDVLIKEHAPYGVLACDENMLKVRQAYLLCFDHDRKVPKWTMYHITPDFRDLPPRTGIFSTFRSDPDLDNEAKNSDYNGLLSSRGYARGHFTPYGVLGGDRDHDGQYASLTDPSDPDDEKTVFEGNYMSNIAPQHHSGFNGSPGLWYQLERWVQDDMVLNNGEEAHVIAGAIFGPGDVEKIGPNKDIFVPPMFYKIVTFEAHNERPQRTLAFLFPHQRVSHGEIQNFLTSIDVVEAMTGLDFFSNIEIDEDSDTWETWEKWFNSNNDDASNNYND